MAAFFIIVFVGGQKLKKIYENNKKVVVSGQKVLYNNHTRLY